MTLKVRSLRSVRTGIPAVHSLRASRRNTLGVRIQAASLKASLKKPSITRGEPHRFIKEEAPTGIGRKSGWGTARNRKFQRILAARKKRSSGSIANWRRGRKRVSSR